MKKLGKYLDERSLPRLGVLLCFSAVFMLFASPYTTPLNAYYGYDSAVFMSFGKGITHGLRLYLDLYDNKGPMIFLFQRPWLSARRAHGSLDIAGRIHDVRL